jgi:glutathione reductase (NADPH)
MQQYDVLVIGGGSGGLAVAERAAQHGAKVILFDPKPLGGTCVNEGCVPKKLTWYAAHHASHARIAGEFAVDVEVQGLRYADLVQRRSRFLSSLNNYWANYLRQLGVEVIQAAAELAGPGQVRAGEETYSGARVVIATGGEPLVPNMPGATLGANSDDFFQWQDLPKNIAIIGAGYIGLEMAGMLRAFGVDVTVIAMEPRILEVFDPMISDVLAYHMEEQGIEMHLGSAVTRLDGAAGAITVQVASGAEYGPFERVLWAVGRRPKTREIGLEAAGIEIRPNHTLPVDEWQETNLPGVFALGDIIGKAPLTPVAIAAGRRLADRWFAPERQPVPVDYSQIPTVTFTHPPTAAVGLTEPQAVQQFGDGVKVYQTEYAGLARAFAAGDVAPVAMKLICAGENEKVVGIHMVGDGVDEMLQGFAVAVRMGATKRDFDLTIPIHPTSSEELVTLKVPRAGSLNPD